MYQLLCVVLILCFCGCSDRRSLATYQQNGRIDKGIAANYKETQSPTEEYVNRVAKRIMVVSDRPANKYTFVVTNDYYPALSLDSNDNTVTISKGALDTLKSEAELAATLTFCMERLDHVSNIDVETATTLYKAGYDPMALLDLQRQYLATKNTDNWLQALFPNSISEAEIKANQLVVEKMQQGLLRNSEQFDQIING